MSAFSSGQESLHASRTNCADQKGNKTNGTHPIGLPRKKQTHLKKSTPCIGHFVVLKTSIICVLTVLGQIMFLCTAQACFALHTHRAQISVEMLWRVTRAHDFQRGHLWSCVIEKHPCKDPFSLDLGNICPVRCTMQSRWCVLFLKSYRVSSEVVVLLLCGVLWLSDWVVRKRSSQHECIMVVDLFLVCTLHIYCLCNGCVGEEIPTRTVMCHCRFTQ